MNKPLSNNMQNEIQSIHQSSVKTEKNEAIVTQFTHYLPNN
jgi:hypothetical protein